MKIQLTLQELNTMLSDRIFNGQSVKVEIVNQLPTFAMIWEELVKQFPCYYTNQKILAIKFLREKIPGLGLADAKWITENSHMACENAKHTGHPIRQR